MAHACPTCGGDLRIDAPETATCLSWESHFDDDGTAHYHDPNKYTSHTVCHLGHRFKMVRTARCPVPHCDHGGLDFQPTDGPPPEPATPTIIGLLCELVGADPNNTIAVHISASTRDRAQATISTLLPDGNPHTARYRITGLEPIDP